MFENVLGVVETGIGIISDEKSSSVCWSAIFIDLLDDGGELNTVQSELIPVFRFVISDGLDQHWESFLELICALDWVRSLDELGILIDKSIIKLFH